MNKSDKKVIVDPKANLTVKPTNVKVLPFDDGSKKKITSKQI